MPVIFTNALGDKVIPAIEKTDVKIDPALFELFDRFECQLLESVGFPCVPITKRAQQSAAEVESHEERVVGKRQERLRLRRVACERMEKMWGVKVNVISVLDEDFIKQNNDEAPKEEEE